MLLLAAAVFVCGMFAGSTMITKAENDDARIADGVYIGSVSVGGMTEQEAYDAIAAYADSVNQAVFYADSERKEYESDSGGSWNHGEEYKCREGSTCVGKDGKPDQAVIKTERVSPTGQERYLQLPLAR